MKKTTKALLMAACALALVLTTVMGTVAYLTSNDTVKNTFTVGKVKITLDETKVTPDGKIDTTDSTPVKANEYKLMPGHTYVKDPTIHVDADSEDCWLFVKVENGLETVEATDDDSYKTIANQLTANGWTLVEGKVYAYNDKAAASEDITVFDNFKIKGDVNATALEAVKDATIVVTAYAVQADGFDTAVDAWAACGADFVA